MREFYAIAGFERFKTLLRVQIYVFLTRINVFLTKLTPFLRDQNVIRAQIARHAQPRTTPRNHVKLAQKSGIVRDPYVILPFGLCDRAFTLFVCFILKSGYLFSEPGYICSIWFDIQASRLCEHVSQNLPFDQISSVYLYLNHPVFIHPY